MTTGCIYIYMCRIYVGGQKDIQYGATPPRGVLGHGTQVICHPSNFQRGEGRGGEGRGGREGKGGEGRGGEGGGEGRVGGEGRGREERGGGGEGRGGREGKGGEGRGGEEPGNEALERTKARLSNM